MSAVTYNDQNRAFHYAVLFSIALHGALLAVLSTLPAPESRAPAPGPITARLAEPLPAAAPPAAPPTIPQAEPIEPRAREKPSPPVKPAPAVKPRPVAKAQSKAPATVAPPEPSAPAAEPVLEGPPPPGPPPATSVARADPTPAPGAPSAETFDAGSLAQYRLQLISAARKYKRYPRAAMDNNWEGDVVVRMVIGANGMITALSVKSSSGHEVLDRQALEMFKRAKPLVQIPPALRGREFTIELRAIYSLKDQESS